MASGDCLEDERQEELRADDVHSVTDNHSPTEANLRTVNEVNVCAHNQSAGSELQPSFECHAGMCIQHHGQLICIHWAGLVHQH